jgi:hypothetical protein
MSDRLVVLVDDLGELDALCSRLGLNRSAVVRLALHRLGEQAGELEARELAAARRAPGGRRGPRPSRIAQREQAAAPPSDIDR